MDTFLKLMELLGLGALPLAAVTFGIKALPWWRRREVAKAREEHARQMRCESTPRFSMLLHEAKAAAARKESDDREAAERRLREPQPDDVRLLGVNAIPMPVLVGAEQETQSAARIRDDVFSNPDLVDGFVWGGEPETEDQREVREKLDRELAAVRVYLSLGVAAELATLIPRVANGSPISTEKMYELLRRGLE